MSRGYVGKPCGQTRVSTDCTGKVGGGGEWEIVDSIEDKWDGVDRRPPTRDRPLRHPVPRPAPSHSCRVETGYSTTDPREPVTVNRYHPGFPGPFVTRPTTDPTESKGGPWSGRLSCGTRRVIQGSLVFDGPETARTPSRPSRREYGEIRSR